jgi:hypothetical protein
MLADGAQLDRAKHDRAATTSFKGHLFVLAGFFLSYLSWRYWWCHMYPSTPHFTIILGASAARNSMRATKAASFQLIAKSLRPVGH